MIRRRKLKSTLFRRLLPVLLLFPALAILWTAVVSWRAASDLGEERVVSALDAFARKAEKAASRDLRKLEFLEDFRDPKRLRLLGGDVMFAEQKDGNWVRMYGEAQASDLAAFASGFCRLGGELGHCARLELPSHPRYRALLKARVMDSAYLTGIAAPLGVELTLFVDGRAIATSGEGPLPALTTRMNAELENLEPGEMRIGRGGFDTPGGEMLLHGSRAILGPDGKRLGVISAAMREGDLVRGPSLAIKGSMALFALFCLTLFLALARLANRIIEPISAMVGEVDELAERVSSKYLDAAGQKRVGTLGTYRRIHGSEIAALECTIGRLRAALDHADELGAQIARERAASIEAANLAKLGEMTAEIAHEVNTPLTEIICAGAELSGLLKRPIGASGISSDLQAKREEDSRIAEILTGVEATALHIARTLRSIRSFARDPRVDEVETLDLTALIEEVASLCRRRFRSDRIELRIGGASDPLRVSAKRVELGRAVLNLLSNARDAAVAGSAASRWIEVRAWAMGSRVVATVSDSGDGIAAEIRSRIMEPFFTTKPRGEGVGLGLAIARRAVASFGGNLALSGASPTTFRFELPRVDLGELA